MSIISLDKKRELTEKVRALLEYGAPPEKLKEMSAEEVEKLYDDMTYAVDKISTIRADLAEKYKKIIGEIGFLALFTMSIDILNGYLLAFAQEDLLKAGEDIDSVTLETIFPDMYGALYEQFSYLLVRDVVNQRRAEGEKEEQLTIFDIEEEKKGEE